MTTAEVAFGEKEEIEVSHDFSTVIWKNLVPSAIGAGGRPDPQLADSSINPQEFLNHFFETIDPRELTIGSLLLDARCRGNCNDIGGIQLSLERPRKRYVERIPFADPGSLASHSGGELLVSHRVEDRGSRIRLCRAPSGDGETTLGAYKVRSYYLEFTGRMKGKMIPTFNLPAPIGGAPFWVRSKCCPIDLVQRGLLERELGAAGLSLLEEEYSKPPVSPIPDFDTVADTITDFLSGFIPEDIDPVGELGDVADEARRIIEEARRRIGDMLPDVGPIGPEVGGQDEEVDLWADSTGSNAVDLWDDSTGGH